MRSGALKHGDQAYGHRFRKPGFSFSEQADLAFAVGFPSLSFVVDGHPDDTEPLENLKAWQTYDHACLPTTIALYLVRDQAGGHAVVRGSTDARWLATRHEPLTHEEVSRLVPKCMNKMFGVQALYRLEALTGTEEVVAVVLDELERMVAQRDLQPLDNTSVIRMVDSGLPMMLLRVTEATRSAHERTLAELHTRIRGAPRMQAAVDVALNRGVGNEVKRWRIHGPPNLDAYLTWLAEREFDESSSADARAVFLGGDAAIEILRKRWREYSAASKEKLVSEHAWIRSEQIVLFFLELFTGAPKLKPEISAWFLERADYARPILLDVEKTGGVKAATAKKVLKQLDADLAKT